MLPVGNLPASFKRNHVSGGLFAGLYVTKKGYDYFQVLAVKRPSDIPDIPASGGEMCETPGTNFVYSSE